MQEMSIYFPIYHNFETINTLISKIIIDVLTERKCIRNETRSYSNKDSLWVIFCYQFFLKIIYVKIGFFF